MGVYDVYTTFDDPIPFWSHNITDRNDNNKLLFYPVGMRDFYKFYTFSQCLLTDHTYERDMKVLSMNTFEYLYYCTITDSKKPYILYFDRLLKLTLKDENFPESIDDEYINSKYRGNIGNGKPDFIINNIIYDFEDFENIKILIAEQNGLKLPDITKSREYRDAVEKARQRKNRISGNNKMVNLEEQLVCLSLGYGLSYNEVKNVSLRKFSKMLKFMNKKMQYEIYMNASMSGFVTFKEKIQHWMVSEDEDDDSDVVMDRDNVDKIIGGHS